MAFYLNYTSVLSKILKADSIVSLSADFKIAFEASYPAPPFRMLGSSINGARIELDTTSRVRFANAAGTNVTLNFSGVTIADFNLYEFERVGNLLSLRINGVLQSTVALSGLVTFDWFFRNSFASTSANSAVKYVEFFQNGIKIHDYRNTTGTGSEWVDQVGGNNAVQQGAWPADDSEWVFYDDGGAVPISFNGTIPNLNINVGDVVNVDLNAFFDGTETPFIITSIGADLSAVGLSIVAGVIVGTATAGSLTGVQVRGTDAALNTADSNLFNVTVTAPVLEYSATITSDTFVPTSNISLDNVKPIFSFSAVSDTILPTSSLTITNTKPEFSTSISSNTLLPLGSVVLDRLPPEYSVNIYSETFLPSSSIALQSEAPSNSLSVSSNTLIPTSVVTLERVLPSYSSSIVSDTLLPTSSVLLDRVPPEYLTSINSVTLLPVSTLELNNAPPDTSVGIVSNTLIPTSTVVLEVVNPVIATISSDTLIPTSVVVLASQQDNAISVTSSTLIPSSTIALNNIDPEYDVALTSNTLLPTSIIILSNGNVEYVIGKGNLVSFKSKSNYVSIKRPSNFIKVR